MVLLHLPSTRSGFLSARWSTVHLPIAAIPYPCLDLLWPFEPCLSWQATQVILLFSACLVGYLVCPALAVLATGVGSLTERVVFLPCTALLRLCLPGGGDKGPTARSWCSGLATTEPLEASDVDLCGPAGLQVGREVGARCGRGGGGRLACRTVGRLAGSTCKSRGIHCLVIAAVWPIWGCRQACALLRAFNRLAGRASSTPDPSPRCGTKAPALGHPEGGKAAPDRRMNPMTCLTRGPTPSTPASWPPRSCVSFSLARSMGMNLFVKRGLWKDMERGAIAARTLHKDTDRTGKATRGRAAVCTAQAQAQAQAQAEA